MDALTIVIVLSFLLVGGLMLISSIFNVGSRSSRAKKRVSAAGRANHFAKISWRSVKISPGLICCDRAGYLANKIFLAREAPILPLDNCNQNDCRCKYIHLDDRRRGGDRRVVLGELDNFLPFHQSERRRVEGRRVADLAA